MYRRSLQQWHCQKVGMRADLTASLGYRFIWRSWQFNLTLKPRLHDTTCCQTGCQLSYRLYNRFDNGLYRVNGVLQDIAAFFAFGCSRSRILVTLLTLNCLAHYCRHNISQCTGKFSCYLTFLWWYSLLAFRFLNNCRGWRKSVSKRYYWPWIGWLVVIEDSVTQQ